MTPEEESKLKLICENITDEITITIQLNDETKSKNFEQFYNSFNRICTSIKIKKEKNSEFEIPGIKIRDNLIYNAVPEGRKFGPFVDSLKLFKNQEEIHGKTGVLLKDITTPVLLELYVSPTCPNCPAVVSQLIRLAFNSEWIKIRIIDGMFFSERAIKEKILSVPTLILDGSFRWTGAVPFDEVLKMALTRDPSELSVESIKSMVMDGNATRLSDMMLETNQVFPSFLKILFDEKWQVRLGAMVVVETLVEENTRLASTIAGPLLERLEKYNDSIKGDIIYILGEIKNPAALKVLNSILKKEKNPEILEAASEAVEKINGL